MPDRLTDLMRRVEDLEKSRVLKDQTITHLTAQVLYLNQCAECGEMDHQDGIRIRGKFRCFGCFDRVAVLPEDG